MLHLGLMIASICLFCCPRLASKTAPHPSPWWPTNMVGSLIKISFSLHWLIVEWLSPRVRTSETLDNATRWDLLISVIICEHNSGDSLLSQWCLLHTENWELIPRYWIYKYQLIAAADISLYSIFSIYKYRILEHHSPSYPLISYSTGTCLQILCRFS